MSTSSPSARRRPAKPPLTDNGPSPPGPIAHFTRQWAHAWNQFWFQPQSPTVLGLVRIMVGAILLYTHLVWTFRLQSFLGADGMLPAAYRDALYGNSFCWSHLGWFESPSILMTVHVIGLIIVTMFMLGLWTRWTAIASALLAISYANRATGALFGLDQINVFLCMYLAIGNCGDAWSLDQHLKHRGGAGQGSRSRIKTTLTRIATRLIQVHMCIVYLFAGIGKLQGDTWFSGEAIWLALASYEYQTLDMTWLSGHLWIVAILSLLTLAGELAYPALVWPQLSRPIVLLIAIPVHLGIGLCMGMMPFALIMLVGNFAFIEPTWLDRKSNQTNSLDT
ncbi:MAG: hypothetical protein ACI87E_001368 [Mariniblastus sp.]|jgi:hypothetical protein